MELTKKRIKMTKLVDANCRTMTKICNKEVLWRFVILAFVIVFYSCGGDVDSQLQKIAKESNAECPKMLDQWTRLDSCAAYPNKNYKYFHTVVNEGMILDKTKFEKNFKPVIVSIIKTNPGMRFMRENEVTLHYTYIDESGKNEMTIVVSPNEYKN